MFSSRPPLAPQPDPLPRCRGRGVNDAPSLKKAKVGVAMGIKVTEVTKKAAEMILADYNFASIAAAVKEGRTVYNNIEEAILFPTNFAQGLVIAVAIFMGFTLPITAPQVLWVNMVTAVALGLVILENAVEGGNPRGKCCRTRHFGSCRRHPFGTAPQLRKSA